MRLSFESMKHDAFTKALYAILVDGEKVGVVAHRRVERRTTHVRWRRDGPMQQYARRSRPLLWVAQGRSGRNPVRVEGWSRKQAVAGLLDRLGISEGDSA